jgi:hypothetical protein
MPPSSAKKGTPILEESGFDIVETSTMGGSKR